MSDVLRFFGVLDPPTLGMPQINFTNNNLTLTWNASAGLTYRVQYKTNLADPSWQTLAPDVRATNTTALKMDAIIGTASQRFYRVMLVN
jgi:hypothetical protein